MAVPYNTSWFRRDVFPVDPDSFPEAMYVQMPDRAPGQPVLLPVVRMGCDTALVVIPPAKGRGATMVSADARKGDALAVQAVDDEYVDSLFNKQDNGCLANRGGNRHGGSHRGRDLCLSSA